MKVRAISVTAPQQDGIMTDLKVVPGDSGGRVTNKDGIFVGFVYAAMHNVSDEVIGSIIVIPGSIGSAKPAKPAPADTTATAPAPAPAPEAKEPPATVTVDGGTPSAVVTANAPETAIPAPETPLLLDFGYAIRALKAGKRVSCRAWTRPDGNPIAWLQLQVPDANSKMNMPYIYSEMPDGSRVPWTADCSSILSDGWYFL